MEKYTHHKNDDKNLMRVRLRRYFTQDDWPTLVEFYKKHIEDGVLAWELDITALEFISSISIGQLVVINTSIRAYTGCLALILLEESPVTNQIRFAKLDKIIDMRFQ